MSISLYSGESTVLLSAVLSLTRMKKDFTMLFAFLFSGCPPSVFIAAWMIFTMSSLNSSCNHDTQIHTHLFISHLQGSLVISLNKKRGISIMAMV